MQTFNLDLSVRGVVPLLYAKQGDVGRKFKVILTDGGKAYPVPDGADVSVWYSGASGVGNYTKIDTDSAVSIAENEITVELISQMLNNAGEGTVCLIMTAVDGHRLGTWDITYIVQAVPGVGSKPAEQYFSVIDGCIEKAIGKKALVKTVNGKMPDENGNVQLPDKAAYVEDFKTDSNTWNEAFAALVEYCKTNNCVAKTGGGKYTLSAPLYIGDIDVDFENSELTNNTEKAEGTADYACVILTGAEKRVQKFGTVTGRGSIGILVNTETGKYKYNRLYAKLVQGKLGALHIVTTNYTACFNEFHIPLLKSAWVPLRVYCESVLTKWANECYFYLAAIESYRLSEFDYPRKLIEMTKASRCNIYNVDLECGKMERTLSDGTVIPADPNHTVGVELTNCSSIAFYNPRTKEPYNAVQFRFIGGCNEIFIDAEYSKFDTIDCSQKNQDDVHYSVWRGRTVTGNAGCNTNAKNLRIYKDMIVPEILTPMTREVADGIIVTDDLIGDWKDVNGYPMGGIPTLIKWSGGDVTLDKRFIALLPTTIQIMRTSDDVGNLLDTEGNVILAGSALENNKRYDILVDSMTYALTEPIGELGMPHPYLDDIYLSIGDFVEVPPQTITHEFVDGFVRSAGTINTTSTNYKYTGLVEYMGGSVAFRSISGVPSISVVSFFDSNKNFLGNIETAVGSAAEFYEQYNTKEYATLNGSAIEADVIEGKITASQIADWYPDTAYIAVSCPTLANGVVTLVYNAFGDTIMAKQTY